MIMEIVRENEDVGEVDDLSVVLRKDAGLLLEFCWLTQSEHTLL